MNEIAAKTIDVPKSRFEADEVFGFKVRWGLLGYGLIFAIMLFGWVMRENNFVNPADGLGYWLGIVGGTLMLLLLFYPMSKRSRLMQRLGIVRHAFRIHMIFGLVGPLLVLYHCNFQVTAINSRVALYCMLAVAGSGIVGRYIYARIHRGLYGRRANIDELRNELSESLTSNRGVAAVLPDFAKSLHDISEELLGDQISRKIGFRRSLSWTVKYYYVRLKLYVKINRELRARSVVSEAIRKNYSTLRKSANEYARKQVGLMRRVAQLSFYERMFSLWHVLHMPLFLLLVVSALAHVLAVHMY